MTGQLRGGEADLPALYRGAATSESRTVVRRARSASTNALECRGQGKPSALYGTTEAQRKVAEREGGQRKAYEGSHWADLGIRSRLHPSTTMTGSGAKQIVRHPLEEYK